MLWNWQQPDWPNFTWSKPRLAAAEEQFLLRRGVFRGNLEHLNQGGREQITVERLCAEALTTSEIEGEILNRENVQSSIRRQLGLKHGGRQARAAEFGVAEMMVNLYRNIKVHWMRTPFKIGTTCFAMGGAILIASARHRVASNKCQTDLPYSEDGQAEGAAPLLSLA